MAPALSFKVDLLFNQPVPDAYGTWEYAAANLVEHATKRKAQLIATKRTNAYQGAAFPVSMLTATMIFAAEGNDVPPNLTLQGVHQLQTNFETGSVSAASPEFEHLIGGTFRFDATPGVGVLTISSPK
jgi:hypothetical protein